tara:strand:+ start:267 stop:539 length:273 start_codon:yes stop_codon:yes gene_type:complete
MIIDFLNKLDKSDLHRYIKVLEAYYIHAENEELFEVDYNERSGYVYIALENGITIANNSDRVEYIVFDCNNGQEEFFDEYEQATNYKYER